MHIFLFFLKEIYIHVHIYIHIYGGICEYTHTRTHTDLDAYVNKTFLKVNNKN